MSEILQNRSFNSRIFFKDSCISDKVFSGPIVRSMANAFMLFSSICPDDFMKRKLRLFYMLPVSCKVFRDFFTRFASAADRGVVIFYPFHPCL